jgi:amino acid permease
MQGTLSRSYSRLPQQQNLDSEDVKSPDISNGIKRDDAIPRNTASMFSCYINLLNTIIGSGMLSFPYAFSKTGIILGLLLLISAGVLSGLSLLLLSKCAKKIHSSEKSVSFYSVAMATFPHYTVWIDVAIAVKCFGVASSYLIVIGDLMPLVAANLGYTHTNIGGGDSVCHTLLNRQFWISVSFIFIIPLSFLPSLDALKWTSTLSILFIYAVTMLIIVYFLLRHFTSFSVCSAVYTDTYANCTAPLKLFVPSLEALTIVPIFVFGYTCQQNLFSVVNELSNPSQNRLNTIIISVIVTAVFTYVVVAICGYATFHDNVESDILTNYPGNFKYNSEIYCFI